MGLILCDAKTSDRKYAIQKLRPVRSLPPFKYI